ncbi:hypothetical protein SEA_PHRAPPUCCINO_56 [Mycobacterium phage Phrappuccino]|uniref:Uncharacterized protein n=1 Tax=Mycobacterium phage Phrappuccino TaxID=2591223 RepID=A0A514DDP2_9CAUD|nr:hypothetical protein KHQ87_gp056 [Mycobacterium phage Phrappuccino]QDH91731.1 hypothetical protein SEA_PHRAPPUCCINO_56 [Mycobacterium phage Phrappuccino]QIQ63174.1 hypothetical protein SEA_SETTECANDELA_56 [Mycobacterium phage Settecandela]
MKVTEEMLVDPGPPPVQQLQRRATEEFLDRQIDELAQCCGDREFAVWLYRGPIPLRLPG